jgi:diguanylate cyclase (GGDEF)-like protein
LPLSLLMLDVDHFKQFNDAYGHPAGDEVLRQLARVLADARRAHDVVARYGGDEFGLLLVQSGLDEATIVTNRLRERVAHQRFPLPELPNETLPADIAVTVSIGVAQLVPEDDLESLLHRADTALYEAKAAGRNQVQVVVVSAQPGT